MTALSSAEAEIYALSEAVKWGRLFQWRCEEMAMPIEWPMKIWVDNDLESCSSVPERHMRELKVKGHI